jgi:hopene-associated glycosyltransferase HpnB
VPSLLNVLADFSLAVWLYLAFARGMFWRLRQFDDDLHRHNDLSSWPAVVAIVPARNESVHIRESLSSLLRQSYPGQFRVVLVDDHSEDGTAQIASQAVQQLRAESRVTICSAAALPSGWTGKLWALNEGVALSGTGSPVYPELRRAWAPTMVISPGARIANRTATAGPAYLWFTDADVVHVPHTLSRLVSWTQQNKFDLTSLMVLLQTKTFPERALIPAFLFFFLKLYPPHWIANPRARTAGAAGACILLRRDALERIGGLEAIRGDVIDDCALARAVKRRGGRIWMGVTRASVSLREYRSFSELRDMIARTAFTQLRYSPALLLGTIVALLVTYAAPVALLFTPSMTQRVLGALAWTLMTLLYLPTVRFYRLTPLWAPALPAAALFYCYATVLSAVRYWLGRGAQWKGRAQARRMP